MADLQTRLNAAYESRMAKLTPKTKVRQPEPPVESDSEPEPERPPEVQPVKREDLEPKRQTKPKEKSYKPETMAKDDSGSIADLPITKIAFVVGGLGLLWLFREYLDSCRNTRPRSLPTPSAPGPVPSQERSGTLGAELDTSVKQITAFPVKVQRKLDLSF